MAMAITRKPELAAAVMRVASRRPDGIVTYEILYAEIPDEIALTKADWEPSPMRSDEPTWHQNVRNIQSQDQAEGNPIAEGWLVYVPRGGYQITDAGRRHIS